MNIFNNFYLARKELTILQESNDNKISKLYCKDFLVMFLLFERNKTREQINNASEYSIWNMNSYINDVHINNKSNITFIQNILETNDETQICNILNKISQNKLKNYADVKNI